MKHLGDITQIKGYLIAPVDVVVAGSPCQDLSIAGKRAGLEGGRSGLFMDSIRIVKEMRANTSGEYPKYFIWENVPGAFSSNKGEDFRVVLEELAKIKDSKISIPRPNKEGKWDTTGTIMGEDFSMAWRVMDAQYWGVPQRRRRISLVMDFRGQTAPEILFKQHGLQWDFAKGRTQRQGVAQDTTGGVGASCFEWHNQDSRITGPIEIACTLNTNAGGREGHLVIEPVICLQGNGIDRADTAGCNSKGWNDESCYTLNTLNTIDRPAVCYTIGNGQLDQLDIHEKAGTLNCMHDQQALILEKDGPVKTFIRYIVRRITPLECERLQGFPDLWTEIGAWTDTKGKLHKESSDSARYKALGNSIALPQWLFVLGNMSLYLPLDATLGSLFDGIGGFPLVWSWLHGKDKCLWASEIEEFPIAVTRYHFGEE